MRFARQPSTRYPCPLPKIALDMCGGCSNEDRKHDGWVIKSGRQEGSSRATPSRQPLCWHTSGTRPPRRAAEGHRDLDFRIPYIILCIVGHLLPKSDQGAALLCRALGRIRTKMGAARRDVGHPEIEFSVALRSAEGGCATGWGRQAVSHGRGRHDGAAPSTTSRPSLCETKTARNSHLARTNPSQALKNASNPPLPHNSGTPWSNPQINPKRDGRLRHLWGAFDILPAQDCGRLHGIATPASPRRAAPASSALRL